MNIITQSIVRYKIIAFVMVCLMPLTVFAETENSALTEEKERLELEASIEKLKATIAESKKTQREAEALADLNINQKRAEAKKAEAEARKEEALAMLPPTEAKALKGTVDVTNFGSAGLVVAVDLAKELAAKLCGIIQTPNNNVKVMIYGSSTISGIVSARLLQTQMDLFQQSLDTALAEKRISDITPKLRFDLAIGAALATGTVKAIADLAALFKTNVTVTKTDFNEAKTLMLTAMANSCRCNMLYLGFGYLGEIDINAFNSLQSKALKLIADREKLETKIIMLEEKIENEKEKSVKKDLQSELEKLKSVAKLVDNFISVLKPNDISDKSPLFIASKFLGLASITSNSKILDIDLTLEGLSIVKENLFTGQTLRLSAVAICSYRLYDLSGKIEKAGVLRRLAKPVQVDLRGSDPGGAFWTGNSAHESGKVDNQ